MSTLCENSRIKPMRIRIQGHPVDVKILKDTLDRDFTIEWGNEYKDYSKRWAKSPKIAKGTIRIYGLIKELRK